MAWSSCFWVRSTGFPFERLDRLGILTVEPLVDRHYVAAGELVAIESRILAVAEPTAPELLAKLKRKFDERVPVRPADLPEALRAEAGLLLRQRIACIEQLQLCESTLQEVFGTELRRARQALVEFLGTPDAREALFLSNPEALHRIDALVGGGVERIDSRARQRLRLGWNYVQRFCAKNDTASFFGPIAWGKFSTLASPRMRVEIRSGPWLAERKTFFEHWVILRLSLVMNADPALRDCLPLTLNPGCHVDGDVLHFPIGQTRTLDQCASDLLECALHRRNGSATRAGVLSDMLALGHSQDKVTALLDFLISKKVLDVGIHVAPGAENSLLRLRQALERMTSADEAASHWISLLSQLEAFRAEFECAALDKRIEVLDKMSACLAGAGIDLSRAQGQMYVGRFPVYEDCARNLHVELGGELMAALKTELEPVMALYGWLVCAVAVRLHDRYLDSWHALAAGGGRVDFLRFLSSVHKENHQFICEEIRSILRHCWRRITAACMDRDEVALSSADLERLLSLLHCIEPRAACFQVLGAGMHSPDFMLAAASIDAIERGEYRIVVGEVHSAVHTVSQPVAQPFCPYSEQIREEVQALLAPHTVIIADSPQTYQRSHIDWLDVPALMQVVLPGVAAGVPSERCVPAGSGEVVLERGVLVFRDKRTGVMQDLLTVMPSEMHRLSFALAGELIGQNESRRISLGRTILKRRSWLMNGDVLPKASGPLENLRHYLMWRHWAADNGLPRHVFVKCESEPKPVYVDFCNPLALDTLSKLAKKNEPMRFSEMRPAPDELWMSDARGHYCSEFRTSFVRQEPPNAAPAAHAVAALAQTAASPGSCFT